MYGKCGLMDLRKSSELLIELEGHGKASIKGIQFAHKRKKRETGGSTANTSSHSIKLSTENIANELLKKDNSPVKYPSHHVSPSDARNESKKYDLMDMEDIAIVGGHHFEDKQTKSYDQTRNLAEFNKDKNNLNQSNVRDRDSLRNSNKKSDRSYQEDVLQSKYDILNKENEYPKNNYA